MCLRPIECNTLFHERDVFKPYVVQQAIAQPGPRRGRVKERLPKQLPKGREWKGRKRAQGVKMGTMDLAQLGQRVEGLIVEFDGEQYL